MKYWILRPSPEFRLADWLRDFNWLSDDRLSDDWEIESGSEEPKAGDYIFFWYEDVPETSGIIAQGKVTIFPEVFPLAGGKPGYYLNQDLARKAGGGRQTAVKYVRLCLAQPVTVKELAAGDVTKTVLSLLVQKGPATAIAEAAGKHIEVLLRSRTTMIDLTYCQTR
jgi:hypothetical protein